MLEANQSTLRISQQIARKNAAVKYATSKYLKYAKKELYYLS